MHQVGWIEMQVVKCSRPYAELETMQSRMRRIGSDEATNVSRPDSSPGRRRLCTDPMLQLVCLYVKCLCFGRQSGGSRIQNELPLFISPERSTILYRATQLLERSSDGGKTIEQQTSHAAQQIQSERRRQTGDGCIRLNGSANSAPKSCCLGCFRFPSCRTYLIMLGRSLDPAGLAAN